LDSLALHVAASVDKFFTIRRTVGKMPAGRHFCPSVDAPVAKRDQGWIAKWIAIGADYLAKE
jgi:hypothetical protein